MVEDKKIGYVAFGKDDFGYGIAYALHKSGVKATRATIRTARQFDVLLFSVFWWDHVYEFVSFCLTAGVGYKREVPRVVAGGFNSFNPWVFLPWAHAVVIGDGENLLDWAVSGEEHPSIFTGKEKGVIYNNCEISDNDFAYESDAGITRIEITRGCKYRCPFCQLTQLKPYREASLESVKAALDKTRTKRVALFAPNGACHSRYQEINEYCQERGLANVASDVRYNEIEKYTNNNTARMGLEGISHRLRKAMGKPLTNAQVMEVIERVSMKCIERGYRPSLHTYFILDLPGEAPEDFEEFDELLRMVSDSDWAEHLTWIITGNVFLPAPGTPLEDESIHVDRDYKKMWRRALSDKERDRKFNFTLTGRHSIFAPYSRALSMVATRAGEEAGEIIYNIVKNTDYRKAMVGKSAKSMVALRKLLDHYGGIERYTGTPKEKPWRVVKFPRVHKKRAS